MARAKRIKTKENVIAKYDRKVRKLLNEYQDKTMGELWAELDKLKAKMAEELKEFGIESELKVLNKAE